MSRASVLARGRAAAQAGMTDACRITRVTAATTDPDTGVQSPTTATVYEGACRLQERETQARPENPGDQYALMRHRELQLPVATSGGVRQGDQVVMTACTQDPDVVGRPMVIREQAGKSEATARRLGVEEQT
jgi:hypothetical protein